MKYNKTNRPELNDSFEKLNLDFYIKDGLKITKEKSSYNDPKEDEYDEYNYTKDDNIGKTTLYGTIIPTERNGGFTYNYQYKNSIYSVGKQYYKDGSIKSKCLVGASEENQSFVLGKEYLFHPNGTFNKVIDHDLGWDFSLEEVLNYVESRNLRIKFDNNRVIPSLMDIYQRKSQTIENLNYWELELYMGDTVINGIAEPIREFVKLDAKTGKILSQKEYIGSYVAHVESYIDKKTKQVIYNTYSPPQKTRIIVADKTEVVTHKKKTKKQEGYVSNDNDHDNNDNSKQLLIIGLLLVLLVLSAIAYFKYKETAEFNRIHLVK